jgi:hypothetical protein
LPEKYQGNGKDAGWATRFSAIGMGHGSDSVIGRGRGWLGALARVALLIVPCIPATGAAAPPAAVHDIDWRSSPLDLNLRGLNGERFHFHCGPGKALAGQVIGSGPYTDASSICAAAVHAGVIRAAHGGVVTIEVRPGQTHYVGSSSHFIQSESYEPFWSAGAGAAPPF